MSDGNDSKKKSGAWWKLLVGVIALVGITFGLKALGVGEYLKQALNWIEGLGPWGPIAFIVIYIVITVALVPGSVFTLGAGAAFGVVMGTVLVSIGSVLGASCAFLIGRFFVRDWVIEKIDENPKFKAVDDAIGEQSWKLVFLIRLSPLFPFNFLNYALGVTKVRFWSHLTASWLGMLPGTVMYVYLGSLTTVGARSEGEKTPLEWGLLIGGLIITIMVSVYVARVAKKAIKEKLDDGAGMGATAAA